MGFTVTIRPSGHTFATEGDETVLAAALRQGERADAPCVVMDEFHFYAEPARGVAWQVPLLVALGLAVADLQPGGLHRPSSLQVWSPMHR